MVTQSKSMEVGSTPGPWRWWTSNSFHRLSSDATGKDGDVLYAFVNPADKHPDIHVSEADARLIAAAPDLLNAVWNLIQAADHTEYGTALHEARAALSKALGQSGGTTTSDGRDQ